MNRILQNALILLFLMVVGGVVFYGFEMALSVAAGGVLAVVNMRWMAAGVDRVLHRGHPGRTTVVAAKYIGRLVLILGFLFAIIRFSFLSPLGALAGFSVFVLSGLLEAVLLLFKEIFKVRS